MNRPEKILQEHQKSHPTVWEYVDQMLEMRKSGSHSFCWPDYCYFPLELAAAAFVAGEPDAPETNSVLLHTNAAVLAALVAWRATKGVYRIDPTVQASLVASRYELTIDLDQILRIPEPCVYIPLRRSIAQGEHAISQHGFFACVQHDSEEHDDHLMLVIDADTADGWGVKHPPEPIVLPLDSSMALPDLLNHMVDQFEIALEQGLVSRQGIENISASDMRAQLSEAVQPMISCLAYLCSPEVQIHPGTRWPRWPDMEAKHASGMGPTVAQHHLGDMVGALIRRNYHFMEISNIRLSRRAGQPMERHVLTNGRWDVRLDTDKIRPHWVAPQLEAKDRSM